MQHDYTHLIAVLDRSGSMEPVAKDVIGGFNRFVEEQRKLPGKATLTLVQFDDQYEVVYAGVDLKDVQDRTPENYSARGSTALYDAACRAIDEAGRYLAAMPEHERPAKVACMIFTDGFENASKEHGRADLMARIKTQSERFGWQFVYLGSDPRTFNDAQAVGVRSVNTMSYKPTSAGIAGVYAATNAAIGSWRSDAGDAELAVNPLPPGKPKQPK